MNGNVKAALEKARDMICDPKHWCKDKFTKVTADGDAFCMVGAINRSASREDRSWEGAIDKLDTVLKQKFNSPVPKVGQFNDNPMTQHADVISVFNQAIALCEENE